MPLQLFSVALILYSFLTPAEPDSTHLRNISRVHARASHSELPRLQPGGFVPHVGARRLRPPHGTHGPPRNAHGGTRERGRPRSQPFAATWREAAATPLPPRPRPRPPLVWGGDVLS